MKRFFIAVSAVVLVSSMSGCAAFCDSNDTGCINKANAVSGAIAAAGVATLGAAAAYAAAQPQPVVYVPVRPVYYCRWPYC